MQNLPRATAALRKRLLDAVWFGHAVRTQILLVFVLINLVAGVIAAGVTIFKAGTATRNEIAGSMRLAELLVNETVQLIQHGVPADTLLQSLPSQLRLVRHVRIFVRDAEGNVVSEAGAEPKSAANDERRHAPAWFERLIGPPVERHEAPVLADGARLGTVDIVSEPRDEIAEVWENSVALAAIAGLTAIAMIAILYFVLGRVLDPLAALGEGLHGLERRDYKIRLARPQVMEFAAIVDRFNALAGALDEARAENLALGRRLITAQDDERRRTALELHDEVGPSLFGLKANVASIATAAGALPPLAGARIGERLLELTAIIDHLQGINRALLNRLRPMALGHVPLAEIVAGLVRERAREYPQIAFEHDVAALGSGFGDTIDLTVYRCVQESLTNAIRHAGASRIEVRANFASGAADAAGRLELTVRDDGSGIVPGLSKGFGLQGMQERVQALGGELRVEPGNGSGTSVHILIPLAGRLNEHGRPSAFSGVFP